MKTIILATRNSPLALWQAEHVKTQLEAHYPQLSVLLRPMTTQGDQQKTLPLHTVGGKYVFTNTLQNALLAHQADIAVHSVKDLSAKTMPGLRLAAILEREDARDVLLSYTAKCLQDLPKGAVIGTASPRRKSQLLAVRPDLVIQLLRGNIETRIKKLYIAEQGGYNAIILAAAGLKRLELKAPISEYLNTETFVPAIGQGALGIECRAEDASLCALLASLDHPVTRLCVRAERAVNAYLGGSCFTPIGAYATWDNGQLTLKVWLGTVEGTESISAHVTGPATSPEALGTTAAKQLMQQGGRRFLQI